MLSSQEAGSTLPLKRGRGRPRSRGRPPMQSTISLVENDYDSRAMTRNRSRSRGRIPIPVTAQQVENKEDTEIGSSAHNIGSSPSSSLSGSSLPLKRGRGRPRSRGRPPMQSTPALMKNDYDSRRMMTRSRSRSRGRIPVPVQQQGENKEGIVICSSAHIGPSSSSSFGGSRALVYKTDKCSTFSRKVLQGPQAQPQSRQEASSSSSGLMVAGSPLPYNAYNPTARRLPLPVSAQNMPSSTVPYGLPMFSFLSTPNPANQASRKRPQESIPPINFGKRCNFNTDELPGCHFQTPRNQANKDAPSRSNQMIVSPLNRLFNETSGNHTPQRSSIYECKIDRMSSYPDVEIIPVSANESSNFDEESHSNAPGYSGRVQLNRNNCRTDGVESTVPLSPYVDPRPAKRIPFPIKNERFVSTNLKTSSGNPQNQTRSITGKEEGSLSTSMQLNENVTVTPVISLTDDENDDCVSPTNTSNTSVLGAENEVTASSSEEAVRPAVGGDNSMKIGSYDGDDEEEEEYHDTFEDVDEQNQPKKTLTDKDEEIANPKKNRCTIV